jgi:uncharacterized protein (TIGR03435 family)
MGVEFKRHPDMVPPRPRQRDCRLQAVLVGLVLVFGIGHVSEARQTFEVASVKIDKSKDTRPPQNAFKTFPAAGRLSITNMTLAAVIKGAYGLQSFELAHDDSPVLNQRIDIEATTGRPVASDAQLRQMLQPLLAERFRLVVHREPREMDAFVLTLAKAARFGTKMKKSEKLCNGEPLACGYTPSGVGRIVGVRLDMRSIMDLLSAVGRPIVDQSGLQDLYDIDVTYTPTPFSAETLARTGREPMPGVDPNGPSLLNAIEEQLGFKLQPKKMPIPVLVIDHIEALTEN